MTSAATIRLAGLLVIVGMVAGCGEERHPEEPVDSQAPEQHRPPSSRRTRYTDDDFARLLRACELKASNRDGLDDYQILEVVGLPRGRWMSLRNLIIGEPAAIRLERLLEEARGGRWAPSPPRPHALQQARAWLPKFTLYLRQLEGEWFRVATDE